MRIELTSEVLETPVLTFERHRSIINQDTSQNRFTLLYHLSYPAVETGTGLEPAAYGLTALNFEKCIAVCALCIYYTKKNFKSQANASRHEKFFSDFSLFHGRSASILYIHRRHFSFYRTNIHLYQARSDEMVQVFSCGVPLCETTTFVSRRVIASLPHIFVHRKDLPHIGRTVMDSAVIISILYSPGTLVAGAGGIMR